MDTLLYSLLRVTIIILIVRTLMRLLMNSRTHSVRLVKRDPSSTDHSGQPEGTNQETAAQTQSEPPANQMEMVMDETCLEEVPKNRAYILMDWNDQPHYFCSWECRQKFIDDGSPS